MGAGRFQETPKLTIPHPRIQDRAFVLKPLIEIMPEFTHPVLGHSIEYLMKKLEDKLEVRKLNG